MHATISSLIQANSLNSAPGTLLANRILEVRLTQLRGEPGSVCIDTRHSAYSVAHHCSKGVPGMGWSKLRLVCGELELVASREIFIDEFSSDGLCSDKASSIIFTDCKNDGGVFSRVIVSRRNSCAAKNNKLESDSEGGKGWNQHQCFSTPIVGRKKHTMDSENFDNYFCNVVSPMAHCCFFDLFVVHDYCHIFEDFEIGQFLTRKDMAQLHLDP